MSNKEQGIDHDTKVHKGFEIYTIAIGGEEMVETCGEKYP